MATVPVYLTLQKSPTTGKVTAVGASSYRPIKVTTDNAAIFFFEIEIDAEWVGPAIPTGITLKLNGAAAFDPKVVVDGLRKVRDEIQDMDATSGT